MQKAGKVFRWMFPNVRYLHVVAASRLADWSIMVLVPVLFGVGAVWYGWAIGLVVDCIIEFCGHKFYSYRELPNGNRVQWFSEFVAYLGNRLAFGSVAAFTAWNGTEGEVSWTMMFYYAAASVLLWVLFQVQFNRVIFNAWSKIRDIRMHVAK